MTPAAALLRFALLSLVLAAVLGCADEPIVAPLRYESPPPAPEEAFRARAPAVVAPAPLPPIPFREATLANGLHVVVLERHALPIVAVRLVVQRGLVDVLPQIEAYAILASLVGEGSARRTPDQLHQAWAALGAVHHHDFDADGFWVGAKVAAQALDAALGLLAEETVTPRLTDKDVAAARRRWLDAEYATGGSAEASLRRNSARVLFGRGHPYGYTAPDTARARSLGPDAVAALHAALVQPAQATLIIAGDVTPQAAGESAARWFGGWTPAGPALAQAEVPPSSAEQVRTVLVHRPELAQVHAHVLVPLPTLEDGESAAVEVLSHAIGGLASPVRRGLRDERGAAYSFGGGVGRVRRAAYAELGGALDPPQAAASLNAVVAALAQVRRGGIIAEAVEGAKASLLAGFHARAATCEGLVGLVASAALQGRSTAQAIAYPETLAAVTPAAVHAVAERLFGPDALRVVAVGDARWLTQLGGLGLGWSQWRDSKAEPSR